MSRRFVLCLLAFAMTPDLTFAADDEDKSPKAEYVQVEIHGRMRHGVFAIGGETTGTVIAASGAVFELDLAGDSKLQQAAQKWNGQTVCVRGTLTVEKGVEIAQRWIVRVSDLQPAQKCVMAQ